MFETLPEVGDPDKPKLVFFFDEAHLPIWFGGDADAVLKRIARYASGWWPFLTKPEAIPGRLDFIRSLPDYNGRLDEVFYGFATTRVGAGHEGHDDPRARPCMTRQEIIDRLGWFAQPGVTHTSEIGRETDR